jgi:tRNA pseudouridine55 synthase
MGRQLGTGAYLESLRRLRVGPFKAEQALTMARAVDLAERGELFRHVQPVVRGLAQFPRAVVFPWAVDAILHGRPLTEDMIGESDPEATPGREIRIEDPKARLLAIFRLSRAIDGHNDTAGEGPIGTYLRVLN